VTSRTARSPWQLALGDRFEELHPRLREYFGQIPTGWVGRGRGVFDAVGTPRRWLWPVFAALAPAHVLFPVWQQDVPFSIVNTPGDGLMAVRTFEFTGGDRTMRDAVAWSGGAIEDVLGAPPRIRVRLHAEVAEGGLRLSSMAAWLILAGKRFRIPSALAPRMTLTETFGADDRQHVAFELRAPVIGLIYEYRGAFDYGIERT
jgi:hypothetical protein